MAASVAATISYPRTLPIHTVLQHRDPSPHALPYPVQDLQKSKVSDEQRHTWGGHRLQMENHVHQFPSKERQGALTEGTGKVPCRLRKELETDTLMP